MKRRFPLRHALVLCKRNLIKLTRTPEQLIDVTLQPIIFLVLFLFIFPLSFGSNVFVQASTMPGWLQAFVSVNPLSHLVSAVRGLLLGGPVATQIGWTFAWIAGLLVVFFPLALRGYIRRT